MIARVGSRLAGILSALTLAACATAPPPPAAEPLAVPRIVPVILPPSLQPLPVQPPPTGTEAAGIRAEYGPPDFVRREIDSELWRYDGPACALYVFLYREADTYVLRHLETMPSAPDGGADPACLASVRARAAPLS